MVNSVELLKSRKDFDSGVTEGTDELHSNGTLTSTVLCDPRVLRVQGSYGALLFGNDIEGITPWQECARRERQRHEADPAM